MKESTSKAEFNKISQIIRQRNKGELRIADYCSYALIQNKNHSMTSRELAESITELGYQTHGKTLQRTISTVVRYQNQGLFDKPRNAKVRLKRSIANKLGTKSVKRKLRETIKG